MAVETESYLQNGNIDETNFEETIEVENLMKNGNVVYELRTEKQRYEFLKELRVSLKENGGKLTYPDTLSLIDLFSQSFSDNLPTTRLLAMDILSEAIPMYGYELDSHIGLLFPQLLQNLLHQNGSVKMSAIRVLHIYFKHSANKSIGLKHLIELGINTNQTSLQNEVFIAIPTFIRSGFNKEQLEVTFLAALEIIPNRTKGDSTLLIVLCLEHIKDSMDEEHFKSFINSLDDRLSFIYHDAITSSSLTKNNIKENDKTMSTLNKKRSQAPPKIVSKKKENIAFGFVPCRVIEKLKTENNWQERSDAVNELRQEIALLTDDNILKDNSEELLQYLSLLIDDFNLNVSLTALNIMHSIIIKISVNVHLHIDVILKALSKKLNDPKDVVRKLNTRIALTLMHCISPTAFLGMIIPLLKHKNTRTREEIINMITAALLSFPSLDFDLVSLPKQLAFTLIDPKRRVRHASMECFAILAQQLGSGRLNPLVSAVNELEMRSEGRGILLALQTRLGRRTLPHIEDDGLVHYSLSVPANISRGDKFPPDVAWIIAGTFNSGDSSRQGSAMSDASERRRTSAGKNKLPWQNSEYVSETRKKIDSALAGSPDGADLIHIIHDSWVSDNMISTNQSNSYLDKFMTRTKSGLERDPYRLGNSEAQGSYFEMYKTRIKKLNAAGLQANTNMLNAMHPKFGFQNMLLPNVRDGKQFELAYKSPKSDNIVLESVRSPVDVLSPETPVKTGSPTEKDKNISQGIPLRPTLARSASKNKQKLRLDNKNDIDIDKQSKEEQYFAHTIPRTKLSQRRISLEDSSSPFPSRPTIHRTPSGRITNRNASGAEQTGSNNLQRMKKLSNSSPTFSNVRKLITPSPELTSPTNQIYSPRIRTPRAKRLVSPVSPISGKEPNYLGRTDSLSSADEQDIFPGTPKLSKSAQDKLRKHREDQQLRQSTDTALVVKRKKDNRLSKSLDTTEQLFKETSFNEHDAKAEARLKEKELKRIHDKEKDELLKEEELRVANERQHVKISKKPLNHDDIPVGRRKRSRKHKETVYKDESVENPLVSRRAKQDIDPFSNEDIELQPEKVEKNWENEHFMQSQVEGDINNTLEITGAGILSKQAPEVNERPDCDTNHVPKKSRALKLDLNNNNNNNSNGVEIDLVVKGKNERNSPRQIQPKVASSPKVSRKNTSSPSPRSNESASPPKCYSFSEELEQDIPNPNQAVSNALQLLGSGPENWECKCEGLVLIRRVCRFHPDCLSHDVHNIVDAVLGQVKNLRSQVTRQALIVIADLFATMPKLMEPELEVILKLILPKSSDTNQFIRADVDMILNNVVQYVHAGKAASTIINTGVGHRNDLVRKCCSKGLADIAESVGPSRILSLHKDIIAVTGKLVTDKQPDARYHARRILYLLRDHPELDNLLEKHLISANKRPVRDVVDILRKKGLGEPPNHGSATMRQSMRNGLPSPATTRRSRNNTTPSSRKDNTDQTDVARQNSSGRQKKRIGRSDSMKATQFDAECLSKLGSKNWSDRYEALDDFYDLVSMNPSSAAAHPMKVFDALCPRLSDSNSKVSLYALQTLNRCIPILRDNMSSTMTLIIDNLKTPLSSKNDAIYQAAKDCLTTLVRYTDNVHLIHPLITSVQYGNVRNKPEFTERLADIIQPVYVKKPGLINRLVLPLLWNLLSTQTSGAVTPGRANLQNAVARLCQILFQCLGDELFDEASTKGSRATQRLEAILQ